MITENTSRRALEMGLYRGARIEVLSNTGGEDDALVVLAGDCRLVVPRELAGTVMVRRIRGRRRRGWV